MVKKNVSREDGSRDVMVRNDSDEGFGLIVPRPLSGLVKLQGSDLAGPAVGLVGTLVGTLLARKYGHKLSSKVVSFAPLFGAVFGSLVSIPLYWWKGSKIVTDAVVTSVAVGTGIFGFEMIQTGEMFKSLQGIVTEPYRGIVTEPMGALPARAYESTSLPSSMNRVMDPEVYGRGGV